MIGTLKSIDVSSLTGQILKKVELAELVLKLSFEKQVTIHVEEYWEYLDKDLKLIDRTYSSKLRKSFLLPELVDCKLIKVEKLSLRISFSFNNGKFLIFSIVENTRSSDFISHHIQTMG